MKLIALLIILLFPSLCYANICQYHDGCNIWTCPCDVLGNMTDGKCVSTNYKCDDPISQWTLISNIIDINLPDEVFFSDTMDSGSKIEMIRESLNQLIGYLKQK